MMAGSLRLIRLLRPFWGWLALGVLAGIVRLFGNIGLMAASGWFVTAMGIAWRAARWIISPPLP